MLTHADFAFFTQLNISINNILAFAAVMNSGGLLPASYYMNCSQASVSLSLKKFCTCFPSKLFNREGRCLNPTPEAFALYERIAPLIIHFREVIDSGYTSLNNGDKLNIA